MKFIYKHAKIFALIQMLSAVSLAGCSIWYGAWYPDAQARLQKEGNKPDKPNFFEVSKENISWQSPVGYTGILLVFGLISGIGGIASAFRLTDLEVKESQFNKEQEDHFETQKNYYDAIHDHLNNFFCKQVDGFDDTCRASLYRHESSSRRFHMIFRRSPMTKYESKGRVMLPDNEGIVGAAYQNGEFVYISNLPSKINKQDYANAVNEKLKSYGVEMARSTINNLKMPSRCYLGCAIRDIGSNKKYAILVLESTDEDKFDPQRISNFLRDKSMHFTKYVQHLVSLDSKLNPYGGALDEN